MTTIAIDPGASGGLAYQRDNQPPSAIPMPATEGDLEDLLRGLITDPTQTVAVVEQVGGYVPGRPQPGSAMFKFGRNFGFILGVLQTLGVRVELVRPQAWQKALSLGKSKDCPDKAAWKAKLKAEAQRLFPELRPTLATADALLLLEFAHRHPSRAARGTTSTFINEQEATCKNQRGCSAQKPGGEKRVSQPCLSSLSGPEPESSLDATASGGSRAKPSQVRPVPHVVQSESRSTQTPPPSRPPSKKSNPQ